MKMKGLHAISIGSGAWLWAHVRSLRNQIIMDADRRQTAHLFEVARGQPPAIGSGYRTGWSPFSDPNVTREFMLNPLCGRLRTQSLAPYFAIDAWGGNRCPNCIWVARERGITVRDYNDLIRSDPWHSIGWNERLYTIDPVSGQ